jgi:hypothetical protein
MRYFIAIFCSPLALLLALRPGAAILNAILYIGAWLGLFLFFIPGMLLWFLGVIHAWVVINNAKADRRADRIIRSQQRRQ